jgi:hypothetical protein
LQYLEAYMFTNIHMLKSFNESHILCHL